MRQAVLTRPGEIRIEEAPMPAPTGDELLVRVEACGVCGSDRAIFAGHHPISPPVVLGHEYAGTVVELGPRATGFNVGDRVVVDPNIMCGRCIFCRRGQVQLCQAITPLGISRPGGFAELSLVPAPNAYPIPQSLTFEEAALVEPLACCVRGIQQADVRLGAVVLVLGAGPIGLLLAQLARLRGASVVISVDPLAERREVAAMLAADVTLDASDPAAVRDAVMSSTAGLGADVVIEASGRTSAATQSLELVQPGGTVVWFGACPQSERVEVAPLWVNDREITIRGSNINPFTHQTALSLIEHHRVRVADIVSERVGLDALVGALGDAPASAGKVIVNPGAAS
jgi:L-iditol 2-dehydrogenase